MVSLLGHSWAVSIARPSARTCWHFTARSMPNHFKFGTKELETNRLLGLAWRRFHETFRRLFVLGCCLVCFRPASAMASERRRERPLLRRDSRAKRNHLGQCPKQCDCSRRVLGDDYLRGGESVRLQLDRRQFELLVRHGHGELGTVA